MKTTLSTCLAPVRPAYQHVANDRLPTRFYRYWLCISLFLLSSATITFAQTLSASMPFPQFNSSYLSGTTINIQATATTPVSTTITKIEFFFDAAFSGTYTKIGEDLTSPYSVTWTAPTVTAARNYQIRAVVTNSASNTAISNAPTNYNGITVYPTNYVSARNWYVSSAASSTNTAGTEVSPFNTIQKAADRVAPGDTVFVMTGTSSYTGTGVNVVGIQRTGTPTRSIIFMPYKTDKPVIALGNNNFQGFNVLPAAAYIKIQGFEVIGNNASITLAQARQQPGACEGPNPTAIPQARFNGNGISIDGRRGGNLRPHHIVVANNNIHDCAGGGIACLETDYLTIENNITANTSWYTVYGTSGISILNAWNYDNNTTTPRIIIRNNRSFGNILFIAWNIGGTGTNCRFFDGNGIILDNNRSVDPARPTVIKNPLGDFTGKFLVENNLCYRNGGRGININYTDNALIFNNTTYQNGQSDGTFGIGIDNELIMQGSVGARIYNNIFYGKPGESPSSVSGSSDILHNNNLTFSNFNNGYFTGGQNITGQDPQFTDAANGDFRLTVTSPALNAGSSLPGQYAGADIAGVCRPQGVGVDMGAYELVSAPQPTEPATLTITSFTCNTTNAVLSSVNFVVGYSNGTFIPALPDLFINGVTIAGQLGQPYTLPFDANVSTVSIQDQASRSTYFVWNFRTACAVPSTPTPPSALTITSFTCNTTNAVLSSVNFVVGYSNGSFSPALPNLFINGVTTNGQLGQVYTLPFDANVSTVPIQDQASRSTYFVWNFRTACVGSNARTAVEPVSAWQLQLLGNPVAGELDVLVTDAEGQSLQLELVDATGRIIASRRVQPALARHREVFDCPRHNAGLLLLRATGNGRSQTQKVLQK